MNNILVTVAQGIINEHDKYLEINENEHLLTDIEAAHNTQMVAILNRIKIALAEYTEQTGIVNDDLLAAIIIETHGEIVNETHNWLNEKHLA